MAEKKFRNAAAKLLAQHSSRPGDRQIYETAAQSPGFARTADTRAAETRASEPKPQRAPTNPEPFGRGVNHDIAISSPVLLKQNQPARHSATQADMVAALIKYIIIIVAALLGCAVVVFAGFQTGLGMSGNIAIGLFGGAILGLLVTYVL